MKRAPNPTRMELLRLQRRRTMAERGHKLLKDKLDGLTHQFMEILKVYRQNSGIVNKNLSSSFTKFVLASSLMIEEELDAITFAPLRSVRIEVSSKNIMGVRVPVYGIKTENDLRNYGSLYVPVELDQAESNFAKLLPDLIKLAQVKRTIEQLAKEIYDVKRRVNALEFVLIPELDSMIKYIRMKLEEMERASRVALIKVKEALDEV